MFDVTKLGSSVASFKSYPPQKSYSQAVVILDDGSQYVFGSDAGQTLRVEIPFGTLEMAQRIHSNIAGYRYQPYEATGAILDPAAELGDGVVIKGVQSGIYTMDTTFGHLYRADISAPSEEEIDYTSPYKSKETRETRRINRSLQDVRADLTVQADRITAEVEERTTENEVLRSKIESTSSAITAYVTKTGGDPKSFGWELTVDSWLLKSNGGEVLKATKDGVEIIGVIKATGGDIGGFSIGQNELSYNKLKWDSEDIEQGAYIGVNGIRLGKNFSVDMYGNLTAKNGTFDGTIYAGNIVFGETGGYLDGGAIADMSLSGTALHKNTIGTSRLSAGVNTSLGYANTAHNFFEGTYTANKLFCNELSASVKVSAKTLYQGGVGFYSKSVTFKDQAGTNVTISYWSPNSKGG